MSINKHNASVSGTFRCAQIPLTLALVRRAKRGVSGRVKVLIWKGVNHPPLPSVAPLAER